MLPELRDLQIFVACCREGSMSRAARSLFVTPNAVSQAVQRLERQVGGRLFDRTTRSMRLTTDGAGFLARVAPAMAELALAVREMDAARDELAGPIRLAAPADLARGWLAHALDAFLQAHPLVILDLVVGDRTLDLVEQRLDLAVRYGELPDSSLVARRLVDGHRVIVGSPAYLARKGAPDRPEDLVHHEALAWSGPTGPRRRWTLTRGDEAVTVEVPVARAADDGEVVRGWAVRGFGLAAKSPLDVAADLAAGRLVQVLPDWRGDHAPLYVVLPAGGRHPARIRALVDHLRSSVTPPSSPP